MKNLIKRVFFIALNIAHPFWGSFTFNRNGFLMQNIVVFGLLGTTFLDEYETGTFLYYLEIILLIIFFSIYLLSIIEAFRSKVGSFSTQRFLLSLASFALMNLVIIKLGIFP